MLICEAAQRIGFNKPNLKETPLQFVNSMRFSQYVMCQDEITKNF